MCGALVVAGSHDMNLIPLQLWLGKAQEVGNIRNLGQDALDDVNPTWTFCRKPQICGKPFALAAPTFLLAVQS